MSEENRRPIRARSVEIFQKIAASLARTNVSPNQISSASVLMSAIVPLAMWVFPAGGWAASVAAILGIQLRLVCNLLDGMVAIEGGKRSAVGEIYNEFPDRLADSVILLGVMLPFREESGAWALGWATCFFAILTAYTRVLGASAKTKHFYGGPMAKQHRMAFLCVVLLVVPVLPQSIPAWTVVRNAYLLICFGCVVTVIWRLLYISTALKKPNGS
jgi:phosphatidylglycerophosphate synthase